MFNKVEFSDLYKFLTSIGFVIMGFSVLIPWLFLKQNIGLQISSEEYNNLYETSKELTDKRIELGTLIVKYIPYIFSSLFILGLSSSIFGIYNWRKKQKNVDKTDELNLKDLEFKIENLTPEQVEEKIDKEAKEDLNIEEYISKKDELLHTAVSKKPKYKNFVYKLDKFKIDIRKIEDLFYNKIKNYNSFLYQINRNIIIGEEFKIDLFLRSKDYQQGPDIFIDIKFLQNKLNFEIVENGMANLRKAYSSYLLGNKKRLKAYLFIIYKSDIADGNEIKRFNNANRAFQARYRNLPFEIITLSDIEANNYDIKKIIK